MTRPWTTRAPLRRPYADRSRGQALAEFALILPVFLVLTLGVVDGARIFTANIALTNGVREAALYASQGKSYLDAAGISGAVNGEAFGLNAGQLVITTKCESVPADKVGAPSIPPEACSSIKTYTRVTVKATYGVDLFVTALPIIGLFWSDPVPLTSVATGRILQ